MRSISKVEVYLENFETHKQEIVTLSNLAQLDIPLNYQVITTKSGHPCNVYMSKQATSLLKTLYGDIYTVTEVRGASLRDLLREVINDLTVDS